MIIDNHTSSLPIFYPVCLTFLCPPLKKMGYIVLLMLVGQRSRSGGIYVVRQFLFFEVCLKVIKKVILLYLQIESPEVHDSSRTRSAASNPHDFLGMLDGGADSRSPSRSPYPYPCLSPISSGAGKLCVDRDKAKQMEETFLKKKIKKDKNLITTSDIEKLEERFTRNSRSKTASATEIAIPEVLQTGYIYIYLLFNFYMYIIITFSNYISL